MLLKIHSLKVQNLSSEGVEGKKKSKKKYIYIRKMNKVLSLVRSFDTNPKYENENEAKIHINGQYA